MKIRGLLFDLDGTLVDTAPDLVAALNAALTAAGRPRMSYALARNVVSFGAPGLIRRGFGLAEDSPIPDEHRLRLLEHYTGNICGNSRLFIEIDNLLNLVSKFGLGWGIVTNKSERLTHALLGALSLKPQCVVGGDTLPRRKPHPDPLLHAASLLSVDPAECVYVGDSQRDVEAAHAAGMTAIAAGYGYIRPGEEIDAWGADAAIRHPSDLDDAVHTLISRARVK